MPRLASTLAPLALFTLAACGHHDRPTPRPPPRAHEAPPAPATIPAAQAPETWTGGTLSPDATFGERGRAILALGEDGPDFGTALLLYRAFRAAVAAPDGSLYVVGNALHGGLVAPVVAHVTSAGAVDTSFGDAGLVRLGAVRGFGRALALQPDGHVLAAGFEATATPDAMPVVLVARLAPDGTRDATFGHDGIARLDLGGHHGEPVALYATADGGAVLVGTRIETDDPTETVDAYVAHVDAHGALDARFADGGVARLTGMGRDTRVLALADGTLIVAASHGAPVAGTVVRVTARGVLDPTFGDHGTAGFPDPVSALARDTTGRLYVAGASGGAVFVARLGPDGHTDTTYGATGVARGPSGPSERVALLLASPRGGVLVVGVTGTRSAATAVLSSFDAHGTLDPTFGDHGMLHGEDAPAILFAGTVDAHGRIVAVGTTSTGALALRWTPPSG